MRKNIFLILIITACNGKTYYCNCTYTDSLNMQRQYGEPMQCMSKQEAQKSCAHEMQYIPNRHNM